MEVQALAQREQLGVGQLLDLVGGVAPLDLGAERPALHRLGEDHRRRAGLLGGGLVGGVELAVVVPAARQGAQLVVGQVLDELAQAGVGTEEVLADVGAVLGGVALELAVDGRVHPLEEHAVLVAGEEVVPRRAPDDLDDVPAGAAEHGLELLDDLAVAAHRPVEPLQVAVDDPDEVVEPLARGEGDRAEGLGLVALAVAEEAPHPALAGVVDAALVEVPVEARLVDRRQRAEAHRDRRVLPEVRHEPGVRVARQAVAADLAAEPVELLLGQAALEVGPGVDAGRGVALEVDVVAGEAVVLAPEEVVEADVVERGRRGEGGEVAADAVGVLVRLHDHDGRVPADVGADAALDVLVAGEPGLLLGRDRVDVRRAHRGRVADLELAGALEQLRHEEPGAGLALGLDELGERVEPLLGLGRIDVGELVHEAVDDHGRHCLASRCEDAPFMSECQNDGLHRRGLLRQPRPRRVGVGRARRAVRVAATRRRRRTRRWS